MKKFTISPVLVAMISLSITIVLLVIGMCYGAYILQSKLSSYATIVDHQKIDIEANEAAQSNAVRLQDALKKNAVSIDKAATIVADAKSYQYQDQIVQDVNAYATSAGISVLSYAFTPTPPSTSKTASITGLKTVSATITLKNPIPYSNFIQFLRLIEQNLTKMQVSQLNLTTDLKSPGTVNSPSMTLEVYVR
jgi:hypothetical protein